MDLLKEAVHRTRGGSGSVVLIHGEAGIGKTRLAEGIGEYAVSAGCTVAIGRSPEERGAPPYWPWAQILSRVVGGTELRLGSLQGMELVAAAFPELAGATRRASRAPGVGTEAGEHVRFRLFHAASRLVRQAARSRPVLIVLDDLHWADEPSLRLLQHLAEETREASLMLLGTYRQPPGAGTLAEVLASLARLRRFSSLAIHGLSREESRELLEVARSGTIPEDFVDAAYRLTGGNPLHLRQLSLSPSAQEAWPTGTVRDAVARRLSTLRPACRSLISAAAVLGSEFPSGVLREMKEGGEAEEASLGEACDADLVEESPGSLGRYRFVHALVRDAVLSGVSREEEARLHARAAAVLERQHAGEEQEHAAELLRHYAAAQALCGTGPVVRYALLAGERALAAHAYEEALEHFETGLRALEGRPMDDDAAALLFGVARTRALISMGHESLPYFVRCFEYYERTGNTAKAVEVLMYRHIPAEAAFLPLIDRALGWVEEDSPDAARLLLCSVVLRSAYGAELRLDDAMLSRIVATARRHGDVLLEMKALRLSCLAAFYSQRFRATVQLERARQARELARALGEDIDEMWLSSSVVGDLLLLGRVEEAAREVASLRAIAERPGDRLVRGIAASVACDMAVHDGQWDEALRLCDFVMQSGLPYAQEPRASLARRIAVRYQTGDLQAGAHELALLGEQARQTPRVPAAIFLDLVDAVTEAAYVSGETRFFGEAESACRMILGMPQANPFMKNSVRRALGRIAVLRSDAQEAEAQRHHFLAVLDEAPEEDRPLLPWHHDLGLLSRAVGRLDDAVVHFGNAVKRPGAAAHEHAWSLYELAATLTARGRAGDRERAASLRQEALAEAVRLGLKPLEGRIRASLEAGAPAALPGGLSSRELEVLRLVARGLTNREIGEKLFISTKTVDAHVRNLLDKTGMANRTEATAYAIRSGLVEA